MFLAAVLGVVLLQTVGGSRDTATAAPSATVTNEPVSKCLEFANLPDAEANIPQGPTIEPMDKPPALVDAWFNSVDVTDRGLVSPSDQRPWTFSQKFARLLCYAAPNADVTMAYYFFRATNASNSSEVARPESDPETVFRALEWIAKNRGVDVSVLLDNTNTCSSANENESCTNIMTRPAREALEKRFDRIPGSKVNYCINGCFNTARYGVYPYAILHEKFITVSDTNFPNDGAGVHPLVISTSSNLARSQIRNYRQEAASIYDDKLAFDEFSTRFRGMQDCAVDYCRILKDGQVLNTENPDVATASPNPLRLLQEGDRQIWIDPVLYRSTDSGRGTRVTFSPGSNASNANFNVYINQMDNIDCSVDRKVRIAMFKLTDGKADQMAARLRDLKKSGCDVKMLMTSQGGATVISSSVRKTLSDAGVDFKCTVDPMHTKLVLIGPATGNLGSILAGTQNMSVAGQLYSEEHVVTFDAREAEGKARSDIRAAYDKYQEEWFALSRGASTGNCGAKS